MGGRGRREGGRETGGVEGGRERERGREGEREREGGGREKNKTIKLSVLIAVHQTDNGQN